MGRVLLHDDDRLLKRIFLVDLALELAEDLLVGCVRVLSGRDAHGGVLEQGDGTSKLGDLLGRHLALFSDRVGELAGVLLHILDVSLDLGAELLEVLDDGSLDRLCEVGVMVSDDTGLVADAVVDVLDTVFAEELVALAEGDLNDTTELGQLLGGVVLDIGNTLEVADELLCDVLPASEALNENVGRTKLVRARVLLDEGSVAGSHSGLPAERRRAGHSRVSVGHCVDDSRGEGGRGGQVARVGTTTTS